MWEKQPLSFFNISEGLQESQQQKTIFLTYFGFLKANYRSFMRLLTLQFLPHSNKCFFICLVPYPYLHLLFSQFVVLFWLSFSYSSRHETHSTIYNVWFNFITTLPVILRRQKMLYSQWRNKKCRVNNKQNKCFIMLIFGTRFEFFFAPYFFLFSFWSC